MEEQYVISMDEVDRKQLAQRLHFYTEILGLPEAVQEDLVQAAILILFNERQDDVDRD